MSSFSSAFKESASSRGGIGAATFLDGIIILIVAVVNIATKRSYEGLNSITSGIIVIAIGALLLITGVALIKDKPYGLILGWTSALVSLVFGVFTTLKILDGNMIFSIYYLLTGVILIFYLFQITIKGKNSGA